MWASKHLTSVLLSKKIGDVHKSKIKLADQSIYKDLLSFWALRKEMCFFFLNKPNFFIGRNFVAVFFWELPLAMLYRFLIGTQMKMMKRK